MPETDKSNTKLHRLKVWFLKHIENFRDGVLSFLQDLDLSSFKSLKRLLFLFTVILVGSGVGVAIAGIKVPHLEKYIFDNVLFLVTYTLILVALSVFTFVTVFKYNYRISFWETLVFFLVFSFYFSWYNTENSSLTQFQFEYWDLNIFTIIIIILSVLFVGISLNASWPKKKRENNNTFLEDNPLSHDEQKEDTSYNHLISKIAPALFTDVYKSSFSIGVIGPWGTGKSSFLKAVKYAVCETSIKDLNTYYEIKIEKKPDTIFIEFSPFLNHNEEQVIHEFFTQLSNMLSERSGRLSNLISTYSEKLAKLSRHNSWFSLFNLAKSSRENLSAQELYNKIQEAIEDLNLKIIVTVDDLDRLNAKEILQVLKLIRNTSNFPNMVFLVAMDKEYVNYTLREEQENVEQRYLEKFFQLELYIPFNEYKILKEELIREVLEVKNIKGYEKCQKIINEIVEDFTSPFSLVKDYLRSYRDVKIFRNLIVSDLLYLENFKGDFLISEYVLVLFVKTRFPDIFTKICYLPEMFLNEGEDGWFFNEEKFSRFFKLKRYNRLENYEVGNSINQEEDSFNMKEFSGYSYSTKYGSVEVQNERKILIKGFEVEILDKTLSKLFDKSKMDSRSVKYLTNLLLMVNNRIDEIQFTRKDLIDLIKNRHNDSELMSLMQVLRSDEEIILKLSVDSETEFPLKKISNFYPETEIELHDFLDFLLKLVVFTTKSDLNTNYASYFISLVSKYAGKSDDYGSKIDKKIGQSEYELLIRKNLILNDSYDIGKLIACIEEDDGEVFMNLKISNELMDQLISGVFKSNLDVQTEEIIGSLSSCLDIIHYFEAKKSYVLNESKYQFLKYVFQDINLELTLKELLVSSSKSTGVKLDEHFYEYFISQNRNTENYKDFLSRIEQLEVSKSMSGEDSIRLHSFLSLIEKTENKVYLNYKFSDELDFSNSNNEQFLIELNNYTDLKRYELNKISLRAINGYKLIQNNKRATLFAEVHISYDPENKYLGLRTLIEDIKKNSFDSAITRLEIRNELALLDDDTLMSYVFKDENNEETIIKVSSIENYNNAK